MFYSLWLASLTSKCKALLTLLKHIGRDFLFKQQKQEKTKMYCASSSRSVGSQMGSPIVHHDNYVRVC